MNELFYHLHACVELIQGKNVLLGEEPQPWAFPKVLEREQRQRYGDTAKRGLEKGDVTHELTPLMILWGRVLAWAACSYLMDLPAGRGHQD